MEENVFGISEFKNKKDIEDIKKYLDYTSDVLNNLELYQEYLAKNLDKIFTENINLKETIKDLTSRIEKLES